MNLLRLFMDKLVTCIKSEYNIMFKIHVFILYKLMTEVTYNLEDLTYIM